MTEQARREAVLATVIGIILIAGFIFVVWVGGFRLIFTIEAGLLTAICVYVAFSYWRWYFREVEAEKEEKESY